MSRLMAIAALALAAGGCGGGSSGDLLSVTGTVKNADGSLIVCEAGSVTFVPANGGKAAVGALKPDGTFELTTEKPNDGAAPGTYKVMVNALVNYMKQDLAVAKQYGDATTTPLEATVDADHTHFDFKVEK